MPILALLLLLATPESTAGTIMRDLTPEVAGWLHVDTGAEELSYLRVLPETPVVWHLDGKTFIDRSALRVGARIRWVGPCMAPERVEVVTLGPLGLAVAVEEWVIASCGAKLQEGLSASELAVVEALGSRSYLVREAVTRALREQGPRALRLLCWARHARDGEVRARARAESLLGDLGWRP